MDTGQSMRVMDLRGTYKGGGGPDKTILLSALKHDAERFFVLVTYLRDPADTEFEITDRARDLGIDYAEVEDRRLVDRSCVSALNRLVREHSIGLVHTHDHKSSLYGYLLRQMNPGLRLMHTCHLYPIYERDEFESSKAYMSHRARRRASLFLINRSHRPIIAVSDAVRDTLIAEGIAPSGIETLHNAIDVDQWRRERGNPVLKRELGLSDDEPLIGTVARISHQKDLPTFFRVAAAVRQKAPGARFVIVGDGAGDDLAKARRRVGDQGLSGVVHFTGHRNDLLDIYASFDIFLMTSTAEGLPNTVLEAMAMEIPVVSTAVDGVPELVRDGTTGFLHEMKDVAGLSGSVLRLLQDPTLAREFAAASRERILEAFDFDERVRKTEAYYSEFLSRTASMA